MATASLPTATEQLTRHVEWRHIPIENAALFAVRPGMGRRAALGDAECLDGAVGILLQNGAGEGGMHPDLIWACWFMTSAARALREAAGATP